MATLSPQQRAAQIQNAKYAGATTTSAPPKPNLLQKAGNFVGGMAKDAYSTLIGTPATRIGQALVAPGILQQNNARTDLQTNNAATAKMLADRAKTETNPTLKAQYQKQAAALLNQARPYIQAPDEATSNASGVDVPAQKTGLAGVEQIGGQALKSAAYLYGGQGIAELGPEAGILQRGLQVGKIGAVSGAAGGAGNAMEQGENLGQVAGGAVTGGAVGFGTGFALGAGGQAVHQIFNRATPIMDPATVQSQRIADATPSYKSVLKNEDISKPITVGEGDSATTMNRVDEGKGLFGKEKVNPTNREIAAGTESAQSIAPEKYDTTSNLTKAQSTYKAIGQEAENLKASLQTEDKATITNPKVMDANKQQITKGVIDNMTRQAREVVMSRGQGIEGDALDRAGTVVGRYAQDVTDELNNYDGTRSGILDMRKNLDAIYSEARGKSAFGDTNRNAVDMMHTQIRDYLNKELATSSTVDVQASLAKQSKLFQAHDVLLNKAETEARSHYGRMVQKNPLLGKAANILTRQGIMVPLHVLEALAGVSLAIKGATTIAKKLSGQ